MNATNKQEPEFKATENEKRQISILRSGNTNAIITVLDEIRENGRVSILPEIFELMLINEDVEINKSCNSILCDLKQDDARPYLISAIKNQRYKDIRDALVSACWQTGLDFHEEVFTFTKVLLKDDYMSAVEAFTVIENSIGDMDDTDIVKLTEMLNTGLQSADKQKKILIKELIDLIKSF